MTTEPRSVDELLAKLSAKERAARRRAVAYTIIPIILGGAVVWAAAARVRALLKQVDAESAQVHKLDDQLAQAQQELAATKNQLRETTDLLDAARRQLAQTKQQLDAVEKQLRETANLFRSAHPIDPTDLKAILVNNPGAAGTLIQEVLRLQKTNWNLTGGTPEEGLNSPAFANYVLRRAGLGAPPGHVDSPRPGDIVRYSAGTTMFYFIDAHGKPFVIGMTPVGVVALDVQFAQPIEYLRPG